MKNFSGGILDEIVFRQYRDAFLFVGEMWDVFEIKGGTRDQSGQKWQVNMTSARYLLLLYA